MGTIFSDLVPNETEYLPFNYQNCTNGICTEDCLWIYNDFFFGLCFSNLVRGELETNNEVSNRTSVALNSSSLKNTKDKRKLFLKLVKLLKNNEFPKALVMYENNHKFDIDTDAALTGSNNIYNLSIQHENSDFPSWKYKKGLVIILDTDEIFEVETVYNRMRKKIKEDYSDQILIYYRDDSGYICYDEPFNNVSIGKGNSSFTSKTSSYYEGGMNYE